MSAIEGLVARSRTPGTFVERRRFTLAKDKAIEKMREYALRDPRGYVLELIQAAVFAGATYIAVDVSRDQVLVAWVDGKPLGREQLEDLFQYLFAHRNTASSRHLVQVAVGVNALLQRKPKLLRIESGDGTLEGTVRMDLDKRGRATTGVPQEPLFGTYVHADLPGGWLSRFQGPTFTPEEGLIESSCRYTPVPILLNGRAPFGYKSSRLIRGYAEDRSRAFDDGSRYGRVALGRGGIALVVGGVSITRTPIAELGRAELTGVICDDGLRKTADQSDIVRDAAFVRMLHAVQPHVTNLMREVEGRAYKPPALPDMPAEAKQGGPSMAPEPLPPMLTQLGPRPQLSVVAVRAMPTEQPLFWALPEAAEALVSSADPARFPFPVFLLRAGQALTLELRLTDHALGRLATVADADFVRRMIGRGADQVEVRLPWRPEHAWNSKEQGEIVLQLQIAGPPRGWSDPRSGGIPARIGTASETSWAGTLPFDLPGVSAALELDSAPMESRIKEMVAKAFPQQVLHEVWRLVLEDRVGMRSRALLASVLAQFGVPHFVADGEDLRLELGLPSRWGPLADALFERPLAEATDGTLTLARLLELYGTEQVVTVADESTRDLLEPLEEHLGFGHIALPDPSPRPLVMAGRTTAGWHLLNPEGTQTQGVVELLWLSAHPVASSPGPEWTLGTPPMPGFGHAWRDSPEGPLTAGLSMVQSHLLHLTSREGYAELTSDGVSEARARGCVRLALLRLSARFDHVLSPPLLRDDQGRMYPLKNFVAEPSRGVHPRHGALVDAPHTLSLWLDELLILREALGAEALPLRFDDAPSLWRDLGEADRESPDWVARAPVDVPGLRGWLGLRRPHDPTTGVFLQSLGTWTALPEVDGPVPCHGILWTDGHDHPPDPAQLQLLGLVRHQLYTQLAHLLRSSPEDADAAAYGAACVLAAAQRGRVDGLATELATLLRLPSGSGTLADWLRDQSIAELPPSWALCTHRTHGAHTVAAPQEQAQGATWTELEELCGPELARGLPDSKVILAIDDEGLRAPLLTLDDKLLRAGLVQISLNSAHPTAARAIAGPGPARDLCLLDMTRLLIMACREAGVEVDVHAAHRRFVAGRLH